MTAHSRLVVIVGLLLVLVLVLDFSRDFEDDDEDDDEDEPWQKIFTQLPEGYSYGIVTSG